MCCALYAPCTSGRKDEGTAALWLPWLYLPRIRRFCLPHIRLLVLLTDALIFLKYDFLFYFSATEDGYHCADFFFPRLSQRLHVMLVQHAQSL